VPLTVRGGCAHDCPDSCAWQVTVDNGRAVALAGDPQHPFTRGTLCAKVDRYLDRVYGPERVLHPLRRAGAKGAGVFERVSWETALADIVERLRAVIAAHGAEAILPYSYAGNMGLVQYAGMDRRFFARLGASRLDRTVCGDTANAGVAATLGTPMGIRPEDVAASRLIVLWGTNTLLTNLHLWPIVRRARAEGARVVVIDPLRTRTAAQADWHLAPRPGTDAALALGLMHVIVAEGRHDAEYVDRHTVGFDRLRERLREYPPERVADLAGLAAADVVALARAYATTRPAVIRTLVGPEKHPHGGMAFRAIACLPALVGAWRDRGGGLLHWTRQPFEDAFDLRALVPSGLSRGPVRTINMIQVGRALTDPGLSPPVKALVVYDANPAATAPRQRLVLEGLRREDLFTVVHDLALTDTARHADYVLPATSFIEHLDLLFPWGHTYVTLNRPAIAPCGEAVSNTELFRRLAAAMGFAEPAFRDSDEHVIRAVLASGHPLLAGITWERLSADGWAPLAYPDDWRPFAHGRFPTSSGRCEFYSETLAAQGVDPLPAYTPPPAGRPLVLLTPKSGFRFLNSSYSHLPRHRWGEKAMAVDIHPDDAATRGIADGDVVRVESDHGELTLPARLSTTVRTGVVAVPHGRWACLESGGLSANALTSDGLADMAGGGDFYGTRVEVTRASR
jgi:anaerobic selenocysteine-containing dehydrogenase